MKSTGFFQAAEETLPVNGSRPSGFQGSAYNEYLERPDVYRDDHPRFLFNQLGDLGRAMLRRGNHSSAKFWRRDAGDRNGDGLVDFQDTRGSYQCLGGPKEPGNAAPCRWLDLDGDGHVDLADVAEFWVRASE